MKNEYHVAKKTFSKDSVAFLQIFFDNGEYVSVGGQEVEELSLRLYDRLILDENDLCPAAESGYLRLNIEPHAEFLFNTSFVCEPERLRDGRKVFIEDRLCAGGITRIRIFDEHNWHFTLHGNIAAERDGNAIVLKFYQDALPHSAESARHTVVLNDISADIVNSIRFDFENCEEVTVFKDELVDIRFEFSKELAQSSSGCLRVPESGCIRLKLDKNIDRHSAALFGEWPETETPVQRIENCLCGKAGRSLHDICYLYIRYRYAGFGANRTECVEINDIREDTHNTAGYVHVGGYCEKESDGTILITFGEAAKERLLKNKAPV